MAGLSNFISNSAEQSTTMPGWYDQAQQNVVNQATAGAANVPKLADTVAGQAINTLSGDQNPFTQANSTLNTIATGAANPWITDATGAVKPNTNTAMGGLFQAQNQQLQQLAPSYMAPATAAGIGSGQFGGLRSQTAADKALGDASTNLTAQQMQAALQNQQTGVQAAMGQGTVGTQGITAETNLGQAQQSDPLLAASALGKIVGGINAPTTTKNTTNLSPLNQIGSIVSAMGGSVSGADAMLKKMGISGGLMGLFKGSGGTPGVTYGTDQATKDITAGGATPLDDQGNVMPGWTQNADGSYSYTGVQDTSGGGGTVDTGGGGTVDTGGGGTVDTGGGGTVDTGSIDTSSIDSFGP